mgnify:CR=1 FL=1
MHVHSHGHTIKTVQPDKNRGKKLLWVTLLNFVITAAEIIGGIMSNSLALISDALHNLGDAFATLIAYIAHRISGKRASDRKTFGFKRVEILAALLNSIILIVISVYLFVEAYHRFQNPQPIKSKLMLIVASIGLLANLVSVLILHKGSGENINVKAAYLHLLGDTLSSVAVIAGALLIFFYDIFWIDPLITVLIGGYLLYETIKILMQTIEILMQAVPKNVDIDKIKYRLEEVPDIMNIHHIHVWNLNDQQVYFECHMDIQHDMALSKANELRLEAEEILLNDLGMSHVTIQMEYNCCADKSMVHDKN